jgi:hypothetical protein
MGLKKLLRKGISEFVAILIAVVIAVAAGFAIYAWMGGQISKTPAVQSASAQWSAQYSDSANTYIFAVDVKNHLLDRAIQVAAIKVTLGDGSIIGAGTTETSAQLSGLTIKSPPPPSGSTSPLSVIVAPKSDMSIVTSGGSLSNPPKTLEVLIKDTATGATQWITAVDGITA